MKLESYKVAVREKMTHAIMNTSEVLHSWIEASIKKELMWEQLTQDEKDRYYLVIEEVV